MGRCAEQHSGGDSEVWCPGTARQRRPSEQGSGERGPWGTTSGARRDKYSDRLLPAARGPRRAPALRLLLGVQTAIQSKSGWAGLSAATMLALFLGRVYLQFTALLRNSNVFLHDLKRFCQDIPSFQINPRSLPCASLLKLFHTRAVRIPNHQNISV